MFNLKFSQLGHLAKKHLTGVPTGAVWGSPSSNALKNRNLHSPMIKRLFCTTAQNHNGIEDHRRRIFKYSLCRKKTDLTVKIPVGMSTFQAAQENKIIVEGTVEHGPGPLVNGRHLGKDEFLCVGGKEWSESGKIMYLPGLIKRVRLVIAPDDVDGYSGVQMIVPGCDMKVFY